MDQDTSPNQRLSRCQPRAFAARKVRHIMRHLRHTRAMPSMREHGLKHSERTRILVVESVQTTKAHYRLQQINA